MGRIGLLSLAAWLWLPRLLAQELPSRINIDLIGTDQELPNRNTRCIMQDQLGFLWLGASAGLWRYDGYAFQNYTDLLTRTSGFITLINDIQKGADGRIWIAHNNGISVLNPATLTCVHLNLVRFFPARLTSNQTLKIHFDRRRNAWVALPRNTLVKVDEKLRPRLLYVPPASKTTSPLAAYFVTKLFQDDQENLYLFSKDNYLTVLDKNGRYSRRVELLSLALQKEGYLTAEVVPADQEGLLIYYEHRRSPAEKKQVRTYSFRQQTFSPPAANHYALNPENRYIDKKGFIWYKNDRQVGFLNPKTKQFTPLTARLQQKAGGQLYFFNAVVSSDNSFWLCSGAGLFKINITEQFFQKYLSVPLQRTSDVGTSVRGLTEDNAGHIWTGSYGYKVGGTTYLLHKLNPTTGTVQQLALRPKTAVDERYVHSIPYKIVFTKNGLYAITDGTYLLQMAPGSLQCRVLAFGGTTGSECTSLYALDDSTLWLGTMSGMALLNTRKSQPVLFNQQPGAYIKNARVNYFMPWSASRTLVSTTNGLYVLNRQARVVEHYGTAPQDKIHLPALRLFHTTWYQNSLWAGSSDGLLRIDTVRKKTEIFTTQEGLPDNTVYAALPDNNGNLWLSTNNGLCRFNVKTKKVRNYGLADGLPHLEFNHASFLKARNGKLYFGGLNGIVAFDPATLAAAQEEEARLQLISYSKYVANSNRVTTIEGYALKDQIIFQPGDRLFSFSFMSPDYRRTDQNRFRYKLEGWSGATWHIFETGNKLLFNSLPPGDYTLRVQVSVAGGEWSTREWRTNLVVKTPWYRTAWFFGLSLFTVALILYLFYRYRLNQILRIQQIRNRISADMHDEIGSTLSSITFYSQALLLQTGETKHQAVLQKIKENAQQVQEGLSDVVWSVKASQDEMENVFARMHFFGSELLEPKDILFYFERDEKLHHKKLDMAVRKNVYLIFKEALHNAAKYAHCRNIWVRIEALDGRIQLVVKDDGQGFDLPQAKKGNGLANMQERAAQLKGRLSIESHAGSGTTVTLLF